MRDKIIAVFAGSLEGICCNRIRPCTSGEPCELQCRKTSSLFFCTLSNPEMYITTEHSSMADPVFVLPPSPERAVRWSASVNSRFCLTNGFIPSVLNSSYCGHCSPREHSKCRNVGFLHTRRGSWAWVNRRIYRLIHIRDLHQIDNSRWFSISSLCLIKLLCTPALLIIHTFSNYFITIRLRCKNSDSWILLFNKGEHLYRS